MANLGLFAKHKIASEFAENIEMYSEKMWKESLHTWRRRKETLGVFSYYAKRHKTEYILVNNGLTGNFLNPYFRWVGLSKKTLHATFPLSNLRNSLSHLQVRKIKTFPNNTVTSFLVDDRE
jgi:hypothetical protein